MYFIGKHHIVLENEKYFQVYNSGGEVCGTSQWGIWNRVQRESDGKILDLYKRNCMAIDKNAALKFFNSATDEEKEDEKNAKEFFKKEFYKNKILYKEL